MIVLFLFLYEDPGGSSVSTFTESLVRCSKYWMAGPPCSLGLDLVLLSKLSVLVQSYSPDLMPDTPGNGRGISEIRADRICLTLSKCPQNFRSDHRKL